MLSDLRAHEQDLGWTFKSYSCCQGLRDPVGGVRGGVVRVWFWEAPPGVPC